MNRKQMLMAAGGTLAAVFVIYFGYLHLAYVSTDNAQIDAHTVILAAKVGGYVKAVNVKEGDRVKAGTVLAEIDGRDYENTLTQVKGELTSAEARARDARRNFERIRDLFGKGVVSQQQYDAASASYLETKAKNDAVAAKVAQAELDLESTKIIAPRDGFVARKSIDIGQLASPGVALIGFVGSEDRWVTANFKETEIESIRIGANAYVDVDAISSHSFKGKVTSISAATGATFTLLPPDNSTGNFTKVVQRIPVKIELTDLNDSDVELLRAGFSAFVRVQKR